MGMWRKHIFDLFKHSITETKKKKRTKKKSDGDTYDDGNKGEEDYNVVWQ